MATQSKVQFLTEVQTLLKKRYKFEPAVEKLTILEAVVYGICHEDCTREQANQALARFKEGFFDWNEVRVIDASDPPASRGHEDRNAATSDRTSAG